MRTPLSAQSFRAFRVGLPAKTAPKRRRVRATRTASTHPSACRACFVSLAQLTRKPACCVYFATRRLLACIRQCRTVRRQCALCRLNLVCQCLLLVLCDFWYTPIAKLTPKWCVGLCTRCCVPPLDNEHFSWRILLQYDIV